MAKMLPQKITPREHVNMIGKIGYVDDAKEIGMRVVSVTFSTDRVIYTMGLFHNGASYETSFDAWHVTIEC